MNANSKLLVIQVAGLGYDLAQRHNLTCGSLAIQPLQTIFPSLTCPVQASFRTATPPSAHGIVANGIYDRVVRRTAFWEQSAALVTGPRIWDDFRKRGRKVAMLFWQQSLGESADIILSPAPIHKHHGGMIEDCYSKPAGLYDRVRRRVGRRFRLARYWGPFASAKSSQWIAEATAVIMLDPEIAPDLCLTYLPALDYDLQRYGPDHPAAIRAIEALRKQLAGLIDAAGRGGYEIIVFGDYAIVPCLNGPVFPNLALRQAGFMTARRVGKMSYPDFYESRAFALCDHEMAHVYIRKPEDIPAVRACLDSLEGVGLVMSAEELSSAGLQHERSGDIVIVAAEDRWLAYPWWSDRAEAPEYAGHVDIHSKPGYDPCELFLGWPPGSVSQDASRIRGSHGRADETRKTCWASTVFSGNIRTCIELAGKTREWMEKS